MHRGMTTHPRILVVAPTLFAAFALGCDGEGFGGSDFRVAVDEVVATGQGESLQNDVIEITTSFTLGDGARAVAEQVRDFVGSQLPCATVTSPDAQTLSIAFGTVDGDCDYNGRTLSGTVTVGYVVDGDSVTVTHDYAALSDGRATLDGEATVTWTEASRHVVTDFDISNTRGEFELSSDRTIKRLGGIGDGIVIDGEREWSGPRGEFQLEIEGVQMRGVDPVPQDGSYALTRPDGDVVTMTFERVDADTIEVVVSGGWRDRVFRVTATGEVGE
jgi:hypothetical protein